MTIKDLGKHCITISVAQLEHYLTTKFSEESGLAPSQFEIVFIYEPYDNMSETGGELTGLEIVLKGA